MKKRDKEMLQPFPFWEQLKMIAENGKMRETGDKLSPVEITYFNFFQV